MEKVIPIKDGISNIEEQIKELSDPWEIFTPADAFKERPPLQYIIEGLFTLPSLNVIYGSPGTLKSMVMLDALAHIVKGTPWLNRAVIKSPALWIDFDNGRRRTHERVEAVSRQLNIGPDDPLYYVSMPSPLLDAGDQESIDALINRIISMEIKFLMIDNLSVIHPGVQENDPGMALVMNKLRYLAEQTGCCVNLIHHQRKSKDGKKESHGESLRGHSSIESSIDYAFLIHREENSDTIEIRSTKTRDVDVYPFGAELHYEHKEGTVELSTFCFTPADTQEDEANRQLDSDIFKVVSDHAGISQNKLANELNELFKQPLNKSKKRILYLEGQKKLLVIRGPNRSKLYSIDK